MSSLPISSSPAKPSGYQSLIKALVDLPVLPETQGEEGYLCLLKALLEKASEERNKRLDRTKVGTYALFAPPPLCFDLSEGFPLLTSHSSRIDFMVKNKVYIWSKNSTREFLDNRGLTDYPEGNVGPMYPLQWRHWGAPFNPQREKYESGEGIDQLEKIIHTLRNDPFGRRHILTAYNVQDLEKMAIEPCHMMAQWFVSDDKKKLSCRFDMRSTDVFLGLPYNIASYALLTHILAHLCDLEVGELIYHGGDVHLYSNAVNQAKVQVSREDKLYYFPKLVITRKHNTLDDFDMSSFKIENYQHHEKLEANMAV